MIDHVGLKVNNLEMSKSFFEKALAPLGYRILYEITDNTAGFGIGEKPDFWVTRGEAHKSPVHVAFYSEDRETVRKFHSVAIEAGGVDNGEPGLRPQYHPNYYAAFVLDLDGNNIEAVCRKEG